MANFPTSVSTNANLYVSVNGLQTTLAVACTSGDTTLTLTSTTGFPTTGLVTIDNTEVVSYTGVSGATITGCTRGADGTTAASHLVGVTVGLTVVAAHHNLLKDEVIAIETALGVGYTTTLPESGGTMTGDITMDNQKGIIFKEPTGAGSNSVKIEAPDSGVTSYTLKLPPAVGGAGTVLTDAAGNGVLSWVAAGTGTVTSVSGTTNQITSTGGATPVLAIANPLTLPGAMTASGAIAMATNKITGLGNGTAAQDAAAFGQVKVLQTIFNSTTTQTNTSSSTFTACTNATVTITPTSASNRILIGVAGSFLGSPASGGVTLKRGATELSGQTDGLVRNDNAAYVPVTLLWIDSPATTSSTTYQVFIRSAGGSDTVQFGTSNNITALFAMEVV